jgi:ADP-ribose pyrophosphatase
VEEVGLKADELIQLAEFYNSVGFSDEYSYVFLAVDPVSVPTAHDGVEEEFMMVERYDLADLASMIASGAIVDSKTIIGLLLTLRHLS